MRLHLVQRAAAAALTSIVALETFAQEPCLRVVHADRHVVAPASELCSAVNRVRNATG